jgi:hypothetical protein
LILLPFYKDMPMTDQPINPHSPANPRDEKLRAIAAIFGDAVAARLATGQPGEASRRQDPACEADADRVAWQTNRLIQHLRQSVPGADGPPPPPMQNNPVATKRVARAPERARLPALLDGEDLAVEHPAVIAHMLRDAPQQVRVAVLRALPGQVSRAVMRRLRLG